MTTLRVRALQCASATALIMGALSAAPVWAQTAPTTAPGPHHPGRRGRRHRLPRLAAERAEHQAPSNQIVDAINAEDIADFPDANLAESLQRLPGVSIDRDNGEGRTITVRGLGGDFSRCASTAPRPRPSPAATSRTPAPTAIAPRLRLQHLRLRAVQQRSRSPESTAAAENDEGSLGATIDLTPAGPSTTGVAFAASAQDAYYENGKTHSPRFTGLVSDRWDFDWQGRRAALGRLRQAHRRRQLSARPVSPTTPIAARPSPAHPTCRWHVHPTRRLRRADRHGL